MFLFIFFSIGILLPIWFFFSLYLHLLFHELSHFLMALCLRKTVIQIQIGGEPFFWKKGIRLGVNMFEGGFVLYQGEKSKTSEVLIAAAGPVGDTLRFFFFLFEALRNPNWHQMNLLTGKGVLFLFEITLAFTAGIQWIAIWGMGEGSDWNQCLSAWSKQHRQ